MSEESKHPILGKTAKLVTLLLIVISLSTFVFFPQVSKSAQETNREAIIKYFETDSDFHSFLSFTNLILNHQLQKEVTGSNLDFASLYFDASEFERLKEQDESSFNYLVSSFNKQFNKHKLSLEETQNLQYMIIDNNTKRVIKNVEGNLPLITNEVSEDIYIYWLRLDFDENGSLDYREKSNQISDINFNRYLDQEFPISVDTDFGMQTANMTQTPLQNVTIIYAIQTELTFSDWIRSSNNTRTANNYQEYANLYFIPFIFLFCIVGFLTPREKLNESLLYKRLEKIPVEAKISVIALGVFTYFEALKSTGYVLLNAGSSNFYLIEFIVGLAVVVSMLFVTGTTITLMIHWIKSIIVFGYKTAIAEGSLVKRFYIELVAILKRVSGSINTFIQEYLDSILNEKYHLKVFVFVIIYGIALHLLIENISFATVYISSILVYIVIIYFTGRIKNDYSKLNKTIARMTEGDFETPVEDDFGIYNSTKEQLDELRKNFQSTIEEEWKSQKMKTELISNVSHDLKTPLTALVSYIDLLKDEKDKGKQIEYLEVLDKNAMRLKFLIEDIFEVSKANSGDLKLDLVEIDLIALLKQIEFESLSQIKAAKLKFKFTSNVKKLVMLLDSQKTYRIFENLITNVTKYSLLNSRVYLTLTANEDSVEIVIKNTSKNEINYDPNDLTERFARGDTSRSTDGSGLGLAIAKGFTEVQNGTFNIESDGDYFKVIIIFPLTNSLERKGD